MAFSGFQKLVRGLRRTRETISGGIGRLLRREKLDEEALEELENALLAADVGPGRTMEIVEDLRRSKGDLTPHQRVREMLRESLGESREFTLGGDPGDGPRVVFVVGVNGGGKTTTVGKLAAREAAAGRRVQVVAADTFRAAAVAQLERWGERAGVEVVRSHEGADPAAVVYQALESARSQNVDLVLVDTAGRLHTKSGLMAELEKIARVAGKQIEGAPHQTLLVLDATTGQNGLLQAREFTKAARLDAVVLTKLDGTARGGVALAITSELGVPVAYVGVGEAVDDLLPFDADSYVDGLLGEEPA